MPVTVCRLTEFDEIQSNGLYFLCQICRIICPCFFVGFIRTLLCMTTDQVCSHNTGKIYATHSSLK